MSYNLLIVDDSSIIRKSIKKTLGMTDIAFNEVLEAENGQEALQKLEEEWVDLVFLDINMPVMNGIEFMEQLRANEEMRDVPVVIVSTEGSEERIAKLEALGIRQYLRKPVTPEDICESITALLGGGS